MKMRIYTTSVISRGIYTPKLFFSCIWYALKNPGLGLGGGGWGVRAYYTQKKRVSYVRENRVPNTRKNCFWRINATRNDIRAIDIRTFMRSGWLCRVCVCVGS